MKMSVEQYEAHQLRVKGSRSDSPQRAQQPATEPIAPLTSKARLQALGRLRDGEMNNTESRYVAEVLKPREMAGEVVWWAFESVKLKLAKNTHLTVDFFVLLSNGSLQAIDVKGSFAMIEDDAIAKLKVAAEKFPWPFFVTAPQKKSDGGGWLLKQVGA